MFVLGTDKSQLLHRDSKQNYNVATSPMAVGQATLCQSVFISYLVMRNAAMKWDARRQW